LKAYEGLWFEIAKLPFSFEPKNAKDITVYYQCLENGELSIVNSQNIDGMPMKSCGVAFTAPNTSEKYKNSKFKVRFDFHPKQFGDYWILLLDKQKYWYSVIGSRKHLWILSRTPSMSAFLYGNIILQINEKFGDLYDTRKLIMTSQS
jgi:apolipoprotein D and lipocalin family protein